MSKGAKGAPSTVDNLNVVIDVEYAEATYLPLPIDFLRRNTEGKTYLLSYSGLLKCFIALKIERSGKIYISNA